VIPPNIPPAMKGRMKMPFNILYRSGYTARRPYHAGEMGGRAAERSAASGGLVTI